MPVGSTLPRRALGRQLRKFREAAGLSQAAAARIAETSPPTYGRLEEGRVTKVTDMMINVLASAFGVDDEARRLLLDLAQEIRQTQKSDGSLWRAHADVIPKDFDHFLALEEAASQIFSWHPTMVPGLLQTREYRRAQEWAERPDIPPEAVERVLDLVMKRQRLLSNKDFRFEAVLTESVLKTMVGSTSVMAHQARHLAEVSELPNVSVRVVPFRAKVPVAIIARSSFVLFKFPPLPTSSLIEPPVVYVEGFVGDLYLERAAEVARYVWAAEQIDDVALPEAASRDLMLAALKEWR